MMGQLGISQGHDGALCGLPMDAGLMRLRAASSLHYFSLRIGGKVSVRVKERILS